MLSIQTLARGYSLGQGSSEHGHTSQRLAHVLHFYTCRPCPCHDHLMVTPVAACVVSQLHSCLPTISSTEQPERVCRSVNQHMVFPAANLSDASSWTWDKIQDICGLHLYHHHPHSSLPWTTPAFPCSSNTVSLARPFLPFSRGTCLSPSLEYWCSHSGLRSHVLSSEWPPWSPRLL